MRGGTSRHVADLVDATPAVDHHVAIARPDRPDLGSGAPVDHVALAAMQAAGATLHPVTMRRSATHPANVTGLVQLHRLIRTLAPAVVHGHSSVGGALARGAGRLGGLPVVYTPNAIATGSTAIRIERLLGPATTTLVAVSESEGRLATRLGLVPSERVRVIPNGILLERDAGQSIDLRRRFGLPAGTPLIGTVARLVRQKAPEDFVAVAAGVLGARPEVHALLIGMGPLQGCVDRAVQEAGLGDRFHQIEVLPDASASLDQLDVFVLPSRFEGAPYTPLEAIRAGTPVVLSDAVGNVDVIEDGISGALRPVGDTDGMAEAVVELLDDPDRRQAMTAAATRRLAERFDLAAMGRHHEELYRSLVGTSG